MRWISSCLALLTVQFAGCGAKAVAPAENVPALDAAAVTDAADSAQAPGADAAGSETAAETGSGAEAGAGGDAAAVGCAACTAAQYCDPAANACVERVAEAVARGQRESCAFGPGDKADRTVGKEWPVGEGIPIQHFVIVMMENRSFDHYFGAGKAFGLEVDGFPPGASNPDAAGKPIAPFHTSEACISDVAHSWTKTHKQINGGLMDGFVTTNDPGGARAMGYFDGSDLLFYYGAAKAFGISDNHHCSVQGPTWVNRLFFASATSFGLTSNKLPSGATMDSHPDQLILAQLDQAGADWRVYKTDLTIMQLFPNYTAIEANAARMVGIEQFFVDAAAGKLPAVAFVEPSFTTSGAARNDEHPPGTPYLGEQWTHKIVTALMASPNWKDAVYIQTYDEHGGFYDHAVPPPACKPDDMAPQLLPGDVKGAFDGMGVRVPLLVMSPWSKPNYVSHLPTENTSVARLLQARFGLGAMTARDANAWPLLDFFDFTQKTYATPPALPTPKPMTDVIAACIEKKF